jgi:hypothetical protein
MGQPGELSEGQQAVARDAVRVHTIAAQAFALRAVARSEKLSPAQSQRVQGLLWDTLRPRLIEVGADNVRLLRAQCDVALSVGTLGAALEQADPAAADAAAASLEQALDALELLNPMAHIDYSARLAEFVEVARRELPDEESEGGTPD